MSVLLISAALYGGIEMSDFPRSVILPLEDIIILFKFIDEYEKSKNEVVRLQAEVRSLRIIQREMMDKLHYVVSKMADSG